MNSAIKILARSIYSSTSDFDSILGDSEKSYGSLESGSSLNINSVLCKSTLPDSSLLARLFYAISFMILQSEAQSS
jgi:hypothetical protein